VAKVVRRSDRKAYAMKTVQIGKMEEREVADALNECRILASIRHPRIVNFEVCLYFCLLPIGLPGLACCTHIRQYSLLVERGSPLLSVILL